MKNSFVKFIFSICSFFVLLIVADRIVARLENKLFASNDHKINYALYGKESTDILILGSSRASHHYVPQMLSDSLGMKCINLGTDGQGIFYNYSLFHLYTKHHTPKVVIYELSGFDWEAEKGNMYGRLDALSTIYGKDEFVDSIIAKSSPSFKIVTSIFNSFCFNGKIHNALINTHQTRNKAGYLPLKGERPIDLPIKTSEITEVPQIEPVKMAYMKQLISECKQKGITFILAISPSLLRSDGDIIQQVAGELCGDAIPFLNYLNSTNDMSLYKDNTHMNSKGAEWYTTQIINDLRQILAECEF